MKNRICQSIWTEPIKGNIYRHLRLAYISAKSIKQQGYYLVLYTDRPELFDGFPYDEVRKMEVSGNPRMWNNGKYVAMENEPLNSVHLDYDVILDKPCINIEKDVLAQYIEPKTLYEDEKAFLYKNYVPKGIEKYGLSVRPYCFGTIGFGNKDLKDAFIGYYKEASDAYKDIVIPESITIDYLFEQAFLPNLASGMNMDVQFVLPDYGQAYKVKRNEKDGTLRYASSNEIGYHHYHGKSKWSTLIESELIERLNKDDIKIINKNYINNIDQ